MKKFNEIGIAIIKCQNKTGADNLKEVHYKINGYIYKYFNMYAIKSLVRNLYSKLIECGKELKDLQVPQSAQSKKDEILQQLRTMCRSLDNYINTETYTEEDKNNAILATLKYKVSNYLRNKPLLTENEILSLLEENKTIYDLLNVNYQPFQKMQDELIQMLIDKYKI